MGHGTEGILADGAPPANGGRDKLISPGGEKPWLNLVGRFVRFLKKKSFRKCYSDISDIYTNFMGFVNEMLKKIKEKGTKS